MVIVRLPADFKDLPEDIAAQEIRNMVMAIVAPASVLSVMPESDIEESFVPAIYSVLASARKEVRVSVEDLQCLLTIQEGHLMSVLKPAASKEAPPTEADLENPKQALEKLATAAFSNANGIERFSVEPVGPDGKDYFVNISYKTKGSSLSEENSFKMIRIEMAEAYEKILAHSQIPINEIKINAQMMLRDKFGNEGWADVFRTRIQSEKITKVNRSNLKSVSFRSIWEPVFIHPIFFPFKDKANE